MARISPTPDYSTTADPLTPASNVGDTIGSRWVNAPTRRACFAAPRLIRESNLAADQRRRLIIGGHRLKPAYKRPRPQECSLISRTLPHTFCEGSSAGVPGFYALLAVLRNANL
jgi:hypothetical protein